MAASLTPRERAVVDKLIEHGTIGLVAYHLGVAESTVKNHLVAARRKYGSVSTVQLVAAYAVEGLVWPDRERRVSDDRRRHERRSGSDRRGAVR